MAQSGQVKTIRCPGSRIFEECSFAARKLHDAHLVAQLLVHAVEPSSPFVDEASCRRDGCQVRNGHEHHLCVYPPEGVDEPSKSCSKDIEVDAWSQDVIHAGGDGDDVRAEAQCPIQLLIPDLLGLVPANGEIRVLDRSLADSE